MPARDEGWTTDEAGAVVGWVEMRGYESMDEEMMRRMLSHEWTDEERAVREVWRLLADNMTVEDVARHIGISVEHLLVQTGGDPAALRVMASLALLSNDEIKAMLVLTNMVNEETTPRSPCEEH